MPGLFFFLQPSFSQPLLASGCEACEVAMISKMLLMRFCKKHCPSSGDHGLLVTLSLIFRKIELSAELCPLLKTMNGPLLVCQGRDSAVAVC